MAPTVPYVRKTAGYGGGVYFQPDHNSGGMSVSCRIWFVKGRGGNFYKCGIYEEVLHLVAWRYREEDGEPIGDIPGDETGGSGSLYKNGNKHGIIVSEGKEEGKREGGIF